MIAVQYTVVCAVLLTALCVSTATAFDITKMRNAMSTKVPLLLRGGRSYEHTDPVSLAEMRGVRGGCERDTLKVKVPSLSMSINNHDRLLRQARRRVTSTTKFRLEVHCHSGRGTQFDQQHPRGKNDLDIPCPSDFTLHAKKIASYEPEDVELDREKGMAKWRPLGNPTRWVTLRHPRGHRVVQCSIIMQYHQSTMNPMLTIWSSECLSGRGCVLGSFRLFAKEDFYNNMGYGDEQVPVYGIPGTEFVSAPAHAMTASEQRKFHKFVDTHPGPTTNIVMGIKQPFVLVTQAQCRSAKVLDFVKHKKGAYRRFTDFGKCPMVLSHRAIATESSRENDWTSMYDLAEAGVDGVEIDVYRVPNLVTDKAELVTVHDEDLRRLLGISGSVLHLAGSSRSRYEYFTSKFKSCNVFVPLKQFLHAASVLAMSLDIELKPGEHFASMPNFKGDYTRFIGRELGNMLRTEFPSLLKRDLVTVSSFDSKKTIYVNKRFSGPKVRTAEAYYTSFGSRVQDALVKDDPNAAAVVMEASLVTKEDVDDYHAKGWPVGAYTLYDQTKGADHYTHSLDIVRKLVEAGVDWIETDNPSQTLHDLAEVTKDRPGYCRETDFDSLKMLKAILGRSADRHRKLDEIDAIRKKEQAEAEKLLQQRDAQRTTKRVEK